MAKPKQRKPTRKQVKAATDAVKPKSVNPNRIGALWLRESQQGMKYFGGIVSVDGKSHRVVVFKNGFKEGDKQPDYIVYISEAPQPKGRQPGEDDEVPF